jgi:hypothetical protein
VSFKSGGNFAGAATVNAAGTMSFTFTGNAQSNAIQLPPFDIAAVTKTTAMAGERVSWLGPSQVLLDDGATDTCSPAGGAAIQFAPTVVLDAGPGPGCGPTTTEDPGHGSHGHPTTPCVTATTATTRATTATTRATTATTRATTATTRATTATTRATTVTTRTTTVTTMRPPGGGLFEWFFQLLCRLFRICPPA